VVTACGALLDRFVGRPIVVAAHQGQPAAEHLARSASVRAAAAAQGAKRSRGAVLDGLKGGTCALHRWSSAPLQRVCPLSQAADASSPSSCRSVGGWSSGRASDALPGDGSAASAGDVRGALVGKAGRESLREPALLPGEPRSALARGAPSAGAIRVSSLARPPQAMISTSQIDFARTRAVSQLHGRASSPMLSACPLSIGAVS
jgi:hypothetical protein